MTLHRSHITIALALVLALTTSCTIVNQGQQRQTPKSQLQIREFQTREYDTNDVKLVMKAVLNTLQDEGFVVKNAVVDLGLITASKEIQIDGATNKKDDFWEEFFQDLFKNAGKNRSSGNNDQLRYNKFKVVEVSVNVTGYGTRSKVRANFLAKVLDNQGDPVEVYTIEDPKFYQDFFAKVNKGVFLQGQGL